MATSTDDPAPGGEPIPATYQRLWSTTLAVVAGSFVLLLLLQASAAAGLARNTAELRSLLSRSTNTVIALERELGYGGFIHDFKNYLLRPDEDEYRILALSRAAEALSLLDRLEQSAEDLGIRRRFIRTRDMIKSYVERLDQIRDLSRDNRNPRLVDEQVRYDDVPALLESRGFLERLDAVVGGRIDSLQGRQTVVTLSSTAGTAAFGLLLTGFVARRKQRHAESINDLIGILRERNGDLSRANTSLNQFAGIVSHDLKTPLRHISMYGEFIAEDKGDAEAIDRHLDSITAQLRQMESIIESLLDFTSAGFAQPRTRSIDLAALLTGIRQDLLPEVEQAGARIELDVRLEEAVKADPELLSRVFSNLIGNSLKYARPGEPPHVVARAESDGKRALISISDNGIGIDPRFADKIFEPLERLHGPHSSYEGVGIGLSLVKSIVESHGGTVWLDTNFSPGTRIVLSLPHDSQIETRAVA